MWFRGNFSLIAANPPMIFAKTMILENSIHLKKEKKMIHENGNFVRVICFLHD